LLKIASSSAVSIPSIRVPDGLELREASVAGCGLGVFATKKLSKGAILGTYKGEMLSEREYWNRYPSHIHDKWLREEDTVRFLRELALYESGKRATAPEPCAPVPYPRGRTCGYVLKIGPDLYVDAEDPDKSNWARYINAPFVSLGKKPNAVFLDSMMIRATRDIRPDEEIFIDYGSAYWAQVNYARA
jgi:hypothetical protein